MTNSENTQQGDQRLRIIESSPEEFDRHMAYVFRRYATNMESVLNLLDNGQHVAAWKKAQGIRDGMSYYMNASEERVSKNGNTDENSSQ